MTTGPDIEPTADDVLDCAAAAARWAQRAEDQVAQLSRRQADRFGAHPAHVYMARRDEAIAMATMWAAVAHAAHLARTPDRWHIHDAPTGRALYYLEP